MTVPAAPTESGGGRVFFVIHDNAGANAAALLRSYFATTINSELQGHMGVYVASGTTKTGYKVTTASTEIAISSTSVPCDGVVVKADPDNAEDVWVGATGITTTKATTDGYRLAPGESIGLAARNLNAVFIRRGGSVNVGVYFAGQSPT